MPEEQAKKCLIYYKVGWITSTAKFGDRFDRIDPCCEMFEKMFLHTGNEKSSSWSISTLFDEKPGLNLLRRAGKVGLFLCGERMGFCPWCGHPLEVQKSREVTVKQKTREMGGGYDYEES